MGGLPQFVAEAADKAADKASVPKPRSNDVIEKPSYTPVCCGKSAKWVEISVNMQYFYCESCKKEVTDSGSPAALPFGAALRGLDAWLPNAPGNGAYSPSSSLVNWHPTCGQRLDEGAILQVGDVLQYAGNPVSRACTVGLTLGKLYTVTKPNGLQGFPDRVAVIDDIGGEDGFLRDQFTFYSNASAPSTNAPQSPAVRRVYDRIRDSAEAHYVAGTTYKRVCIGTSDMQNLCSELGFRYHSLSSPVRLSLSYGGLYVFEDLTAGVNFIFYP